MIWLLPDLVPPYLFAYREDWGCGLCPDFVSLTAFPDSISLASLGGAGGGIFEIVDCGLRLARKYFLIYVRKGLGSIC